MDLLQDLVKNFRYKCITTTKNEIFIYLYYISSDTITDSSLTDIENSYTNNRSDIDDSKTLVKTENENEVRLNSMNSDIANYILNSSGEITKITVINTTKSHKFLLEPKVFKAMSDKCTNLKFDLGTNSGFRLTSDNYNQVDELTIEESIIMLDKSAILYVSKFRDKWSKLIAYNKVDTPLSLNVSADKYIKIISFQQYAPISMYFNCSCKSGEEFQDAKLEINYLNIYGSEIIKNDKSNERILVKGFNKVYFDNIDVNDEVIYSTILNVDRISNFNLGKLTRNIGEIIQNPMFIIGRVGKMNLRQLNLTILPNSSISSDNFSIISYSSTENELEKSLNLNDCKIYNESNVKLKVLKLRNQTLNKGYLSKCIIGDNVDLLDLDDKSKIIKLTFNNSTFTTNFDWTINNAEKISLIDVDINSSKNLIIKSPYININGGIWNCNNLNCENDNFIKILFSKLELHSNQLNVTNNQEDLIQTSFINECKLDVLELMNFKYMRPSIADTYIKTNKFVSKCDDTAQFNNNLIGFQDNKNAKFVFNSNVSGTCTIENNENCTLAIDLNIDDDENTNPNNLDISCLNEKTNIKLKTNKPINSIISGVGKYNPVSISSYEDISSDIDTYIKFEPDLNGEYVTKIVNDSEKIIKYTKSIDENNREVYQFSKIEDE